MTKTWIKRLDALTPYASERDLDRRIFNEILVAAIEFTEDKAEEMKENIELFRELIKAHQMFKKEPSHPEGFFKDMFGEYMEEHDLFNDRAGQFLTPYQIVEAIVSMNFSTQEEKLMEEIPRVLDPAAGTGRFMLGVAGYYAKKVKCFNFHMTNIDIDHRMFTFCTMNAILHAIPSLTLHGDFLSGEVWDAFAVIPFTWGLQWFRVDPEVAKAATFPPVEPHGQQTISEVKKKYRRPVITAEYKIVEEKKEKPKQRTLF